MTGWFSPCVDGSSCFRIRDGTLQHGRAGGDWIRFADGLQDGRQRLTCIPPRMNSSEQFVEHYPERIDIRLFGDFTALDLLGTRIIDRHRTHAGTSEGGRELTEF